MHWYISKAHVTTGSPFAHPLLRWPPVPSSHSASGLSRSSLTPRPCLRCSWCQAQKRPGIRLQAMRCALAIPLRQTTRRQTTTLTSNAHHQGACYNWQRIRPATLVVVTCPIHKHCAHFQCRSIGERPSSLQQQRSPEPCVWQQSLLGQASARLRLFNASAHGQ